MSTGVRHRYRRFESPFNGGMFKVSSEQEGGISSKFFQHSLLGYEDVIEALVLVLRAS